jgi:pyrimidine-nucleoside phosphorylase
MDSRALGILAMEMGGGRAAKDDVLDLGIGIEVHRNVGDRVEKGERILTLHHNGRTGNGLPQGWITLGAEPKERAPWLLDEI